MFVVEGGWTGEVLEHARRGSSRVVAGRRRNACPRTGGYAGGCGTVPRCEENIDRRPQAETHGPWHPWPAPSARPRQRSVLGFLPPPSPPVQPGATASCPPLVALRGRGTARHTAGDHARRRGGRAGDGAGGGRRALGSAGTDYLIAGYKMWWEEWPARLDCLFVPAFRLLALACLASLGPLPSSLDPPVCQRAARPIYSPPSPVTEPVPRSLPRPWRPTRPTLLPSKTRSSPQSLPQSPSPAAFSLQSPSTTPKTHRTMRSPPTSSSPTAASPQPRRSSPSPSLSSSGLFHSRLVLLTLPL